MSLRRLLATHHRLVAVVTRPDKPRGRGQRVEPGPVKRAALEAGIPVLEPVSPRDEGFLSQLRALEADLGVVVAYGRILPAAALDAPHFGCINAHASLLPLLRGAAPIERAVLAGHERTGVTIMQMNEGLDEGDILFVREVPIPATMTGSELRERMAAVSADLLVEAVDAFAAGRGHAQRRAQDDAAATFAPPLRKSEAALRWSEDAAVLERRVRAFAPRPGAFAFEGTSRLKVLAARATAAADASAAPGTVLPPTADALPVACGRGVLELLVVQPEGKTPMPALDWARGLRSRHDGEGAGVTLRDGDAGN